MKIGLSFSRCVRDIVEGRVDINDVLVIIARTDFDPTVTEQWEGIWQGYNYSNPEWTGLDEAKTYTTTIELWRTGKLHQPRKFGAWPSRRREFWLEAVLPSDELEHNPVAKEAWDKFQTLAGLTNVTLDSKIS
jgi:hypothetical protein